jgi:hypothetical protein
MCITVRRYFDCSHVSIEFQCIHTYVSMLSLLVWRTKVQLQGGMSCPVKQNTPPLGHQYSMILVSVGSGHRGATSSDRGPSESCRAPILGVAAARPWSRGGIPPRWLWSEEEDTGDAGPDGRRGGAWAWGGGW